MLKRIVAGGTIWVGSKNTKTLERAPRYEYNPGNISGATQLQPGVIPIITAHTASCLTPCRRRILRNTNYIKDFTLLPGQTPNCFV